MARPVKTVTLILASAMMLAATVATMPATTGSEPTSAPATHAVIARPPVQVIRTAIPVPTLARTPAPATTAKIQRVRIAYPPPQAETNRIWSANRSNLVQSDPYGETLIGNDEITSEPSAGLAQSWWVNGGFNTWTFQLWEGIPWHFGYGEFTAADVAHTWMLVSQEESNSAFKSIWVTASPEIHNDHSIEFNFDSPMVDGYRLFSQLAGDLVIQSKAQWDAAGGALSAYDQQPAGTGSYQYGGRRLGESIWYEKINYDHWIGENPDFEELEWVWGAEQSTRLALLLAGQVQGSDLARDVQVDAMHAGMTVVSSHNPTYQSFGFFGGTYLSTVDSNLDPWPDGKHPHYLGEEPWHNPLVREAFNVAVDRQAIIDEVYFGNASSVYVPVFAPFTEGWSDRWVDEFDDKYGYDPDRAVQLLAEAGYGPGDISIDLLSTVIPGNPEIPQLIEVLSTMWEAIGVDTIIIDMELDSWLEKVRDHDIHEDVRQFFGTLPSWTTQEGFRVFWVSAPERLALRVGVMTSSTRSTTAWSDRWILRNGGRCARDAGDYMFDDFLTLPLFQTTLDMTIDPEFIAGWDFPGVGIGPPDSRS